MERYILLGMDIFIPQVVGVLCNEKFALVYLSVRWSIRHETVYRGAFHAS